MSELSSFPPKSDVFNCSVFFLSASDNSFFGGGLVLVVVCAFSFSFSSFSSAVWVEKEESVDGAEVGVVAAELLFVVVGAGTGEAEEAESSCLLL